MDADAGMGKVALDGGGMIASDVMCIRCGYNLRGLDPNKQCPECGTAIGRSLQGDFLQFRDPEWVESLASGMNWIVWGIVCRIVFGLLFLVALGLAGIGAQGPVGILLTWGASVVSFVGYWKVTAPEPASSEKEGEWNSRRVARFGVIVQLAGAPVLQSLMRILGAIPRVAAILGIGLWIVNMIGYFAFMIYARKMALRIPDEKLARHTRIVMWGMIIPVANVICGLWALILIGRYRTYMLEAAKQARESWAAGSGSDLVAG